MQPANKVATCEEVGDAFDLNKKPHVVNGIPLYLCECGRIYGIMPDEADRLSIPEIRAMKRQLQKSITTIQQENGVYFSDGFLDEW